MMRARLRFVSIAVAGLLFAGCQKGIDFPQDSMTTVAKAFDAAAAYDIHKDGLADFFLYADANGRITRLAYADANIAKPNQFVDFDKMPFADCRHLVLILDGFGYDVLKEYYDKGGLRLFYPPSRVLSPYPAMTDLALEDALGYVPCNGFEAMYFDRQANSIVGGSGDYLAGKNEPYNRLLQYRADSLIDALGYIWPAAMFRRETNDAKHVFDANKSQEIVCYFVSSAGLGTRGGAAWQRDGLRRLEQLIHQVMYETHGKVKITMLADHGHSYTPATRIPLEKYLEGKGWNLADSLKRPRDVAYIRFGLETYAAFSTDSPRQLADDLVRCDGVELASFVQDGNVVVLGGASPADGNSAGASTAPATAAGANRIVTSAAVQMKNGRYKYQMLSGDPLKLAAVLKGLTPDAEGYYDADEMYAATVTHIYPAPLERLWRAHHGLALHTPDVIVSLEDRFYSGSTSFGGAVDIASTHGGLNYRNSTAFIMSTIAPLPPYMRSREIPANIEKITGKPFPQFKPSP